MKHIKGGIFVIIVSFFCYCQSSSGKEEGNETNGPIEDNLSFLIEDVKNHPDSLKLYQTVIDTLANRKLFLDAANWADAALERDQQNSVAWLLVKGDLLRMAKDYDGAISAYRQYLKFFPNDQQILLNLANTLAEKGDPRTLSICKQIVEMYPTLETKVNVAFIRGVFYNITGLYSAARDNLDTAIAGRYTFIEAWMERGYSFYDQKLYSDAEANYNQLTQIDASDAEGWYWLAKSQEALNKKVEAIKNYERAYALDGTLQEAKESIERLKAKP
jgi:tetratricopeptide (TPR) repeat protein